MREGGGREVEGGKGDGVDEERRERKTEAVTSKTKWREGKVRVGVVEERTRDCIHVPSVL